MTKDEAVSFSPREMEVLALAWQCFESEPKIDTKKLARLTGYTEGSASVTIGKIKRKLKLHATGTTHSDASAKSPATPKRSVAKARVTGKRTANAIDPSPAKKSKSTPGKTSDVNPWQEDEEEEYKIKTEEDMYPSVGNDGHGGYGTY